MKIAVYQFGSTEIVQNNLSKIAKAVKHAASSKVRLLVFHECALCGYPPIESKIEHINKSEIDNALNEISKLAMQFQMYIAIGTVRFENEKRFNSIIVFDDSGVQIGHYDKTALWGWDIDNFSTIHCLEVEFMIIKDCCANDYIKIHEINKLSLGYDYPLDKTKEKLANVLKKPTDKIFVAYVDDDIVGYIHGSEYECTYSDTLINLMALAVDKNFHGKGVGKALILAVEQWAKERGCCGIRVISGIEREEAHNFYLRCGYAEAKNKKSFFKMFN